MIMIKYAITKMIIQMKESVLAKKNSYDLLIFRSCDYQTLKDIILYLSDFCYLNRKSNQVFKYNFMHRIKSFLNENPKSRQATEAS